MSIKSDIHDYEVSNLLNKLIRFIGRNQLDNRLERYTRSLQSSGLIFREYYLKTRHPWWEAFLEYFALEKAAKSIKSNLSSNIKLLAGDAKKISTLQRFMPEKVREKYRTDLIDDNRAFDYLFEIQMAWHFYLRGCKIQWHEDNSKSHSEFLAKDTAFEFNVECKRISVDISRKIRRRDFYRFAEKLLPAIQKVGLSGSIEIELKDRLHSSDKFLDALFTQVIDKIQSGHLNGTYQMQSGLININLHKADGKIIDFEKHYRRLFEKKKHQAHSTIFAKSVNAQPTDPIEMTIISEKGDNVLEAIRDRLYRAAKKQLDISKPGLICCYLEGIDNLTNLAEDSGLQAMTSILLSKASLNHIAAVSFTSETLIDKISDTETYFNQGLVYQNPYCKFEKAKEYKYLSNVNNKFEYRLTDIIPSRTND